MGEGRRNAWGWRTWSGTRSNRAWVVCLLLGMLTLIASQFYLPLVEGPGVTERAALLANEPPEDGVWFTVFDTYGTGTIPEPSSLFPDLTPLTESRHLFWAIALPSLYALIALTTLVTRRLRGEKQPARTIFGALVVGVVVLSVVVACAGITGTFSLRELFPLVLVALGVVLLALIERSGALLIGSGMLLLLAIAATWINFADPGLDVGELGFNLHLNVIAVAVGLLAISATLLIRRIRSARPTPSPAG